MGKCCACEKADQPKKTELKYRYIFLGFNFVFYIFDILHVKYQPKQNRLLIMNAATWTGALNFLKSFGWWPGREF